MGQVIEFSTVRNRFAASAFTGLRSAFERPLEWHLVNQVSTAYKYRGIVARPYLVAAQRFDEVVRVLHITNRAPEASRWEFDAEDYFQVRFDAWVVRTALRKTAYRRFDFESVIVYPDDSARLVSCLPVKGIDPFLMEAAEILRADTDRWEVSTEACAKYQSVYGRPGAKKRPGVNGKH